MKSKSASAIKKSVDGTPAARVEKASAPSVAEAPASSPLHLLHRLLQISMDIYNAEIGELAVTPRQLVVLQALEKADGVSQSRLCDATGIDRSTLAEMVPRMVQKGLLRRERSRADGRVNLVWLDAGGRQALLGLSPHVEAANAKIVRMMAQPEHADLARWLRFAEVEEIPPAVAPKAAKPARGKKKKALKKLGNLPMPPLSTGAVPETPDDDSKTAPARNWKPPKPIW